MTVAHELLEHAQGRAFIGDTGYDSDELTRSVRRRGMKMVVCNNPTRKRRRRRLDRKLYSKRYRVEILFHRFKRFRALATRYDKTADNYLSLVCLAGAYLWLN
jgi:transposase